LYEVGQVLYLLIKKSQKVAPVQVVEQIVRKSVSGENVSYTVQLPNNEKSKVLLSNIDCEVFTSPSLIRKFMISNATNAIDKIIADSKKAASVAFEKEINDDDNVVNNIVNLRDGSRVDQDSGTVTIDLGNGVKGKIDIAALEM
tara:strand:+ start:160 stop:591 length:432 start_codon:yes stop_codon:yes gene_type:complete